VKALLLLVVVLAGVWLWRSRNSPGLPKSDRQPTPPLDMVRCTRCGIHVPGNEVVMGAKGPYCSADHLQQSEP